MKQLLKIFLLVCFISFLPSKSEAQQQSDMFKQKKERKRLWRRWKKNREAYNPYLDQKGNKKVSARLNKGNKREDRKQQKAVRKQKKRNKKAQKKSADFR